MRRFVLLPFLLALALGCHAQVPPATSHSVVLNWTAPSPTVVNGVTIWPGCGSTAPQTPCVYAVYKCTSNCASTSNATWVEITTPATRPSALTFTDSAPGSGTVSYDVETVQGSANSGPSNVATANVPGVPVAPPLGNPNIADLVKPALPLPQSQPPIAGQLAAMAPMHLTAHATR